MQKHGAITMLKHGAITMQTGTKMAPKPTATV
jgi:hypothetical protein